MVNSRLLESYTRDLLILTIVFFENANLILINLAPGIVKYYRSETSLILEVMLHSSQVVLLGMISIIWVTIFDVEVHGRLNWCVATELLSIPLVVCSESWLQLQTLAQGFILIAGMMIQLVGEILRLIIGQPP